MAWFVKIEKGIVNKEIFDRYVSAHIDYVKELAQKGYQAKSGYWAEYGGGMLIFQADSLSEAKSIVSQDPLVYNQCVEYELHQWNLVVGE